MQWLPRSEKFVNKANCFGILNALDIATQLTRFLQATRPTSHSSSALAIPLHCSTSVELALLMIFPSLLLKFTVLHMSVSGR